MIQVADFVGSTTPLSAHPTSPVVVPPAHLQFPYLPARPAAPTLQAASSHTSYRRADDYGRTRDYNGMGEYTPNSDYDYQRMKDQKPRSLLSFDHILNQVSYRYDDGGQPRQAPPEDYPGSVIIPSPIILSSAGIPRGRGLTKEIPTMSPSTILPRNPIISMITLTMVKRKHLTQTGQSTTLSKAPQALHTAVKDHMRTQDTGRTTTQSQRTTTNLDMTAKKNLSLTAITDQTKIISQSARTMKMNMPKITPAVVDQEQVSQGTNLVVDTGKHGIQPRIPAALPPRMKIQMRASTTVPTTTMEVQPEAKKHQGQIMEVQQMAMAVTCKTMVDHTTTMSMLQVRRMFTRTQKTMVAQTTTILGIMGIPMKTMERGTKTAIEAPTMTP